MLCRFSKTLSSVTQHETALHSVEIVEKLNNINRDFIRFSCASLLRQHNKARNFLQTATIKGNGKKELSMLYSGNKK
jgi:hypothetical protein